MIVLSPNDRQSRPTGRRRLRRACAVIAAAAVLSALSGLAGAYVVYDGVAREWVRVTAAKITHSGNYIRGLTARTQLDSLRIELRDSDRLRIEASRNRALSRGILLREDEPWVQAHLAVEDIALPIELRLKGLMNDHRSTQKWSYRIRMPEDETFLGMTAFSIQHPRTRGYLDEWLYREFMKAEGILAPRYDFATVMFNGRDHGIYAVEEHLTSRTWLHTQQRRDGVIVRLDDTAMWRHRMALGPRGTVYAGGFSNNPMHDFRSGRNERDPTMRSQRDAAFRRFVEFTSGKRSGSEVFDVELMSRFLALQELWSCNHVLGPPNMRLYYNAITGLLEPVAGDVSPEFDRGPFLVCFPTYYRDSRDKVNAVFWPPLYLKDPVAMEAYVKALRRISQPQFLEQLQVQLQKSEDQYLRALWREYPNVDRSWDALKQRQAQLRAMLATDLTLLAYGQDADGTVAVEVANPLGLPVEVLALRVDDQPPLNAASALVSPHDSVKTMADRRSVVLPRHRFDEALTYVRFELPNVSSNLHSSASDGPLLAGSSGRQRPQPRVRLRTRILGHEREVIVDARMGADMLDAPGMPVPPTMTEALQAHPFLEVSDQEDHLHIRPGTWEVMEDLVLPRGVTLSAGPGTTLRFGPNSLLLAAGPIVFEGDEASPIVLEPIADQWPGMAVLRAEQFSLFRHVHVRATSGIDRAGWTLPGGITFYQSPVVIDRCLLDGSAAANSLSLVRSVFDLRDSTFRSCQSSAIGAEFCEGLIATSTLLNIGKDSISLVGSRMDVRDVHVRGVGGAVLSAAADSHAEVERLVVQNARFAIVSKDLSFVLVDQLEVRDSDVALAAYVKNRRYGPAAINAHHVTLNGVAHPVLVQSGSWVRMNTQKFIESTFDAVSRYLVDQDEADSNMEAQLGLSQPGVVP